MRKAVVMCTTLKEYTFTPDGSMKSGGGVLNELEKEFSTKVPLAVWGSSSRYPKKDGLLQMTRNGYGFDQPFCHPKAPWIVGKTEINQWIGGVPFFLVKAQIQDQSHPFQDLTIEHFTGLKPEKHACSWVVHLPIIPAEDESTHLIGFPRSCAVKIHY
jgi:hypothetical protein